MVLVLALLGSASCQTGRRMVLNEAITCIGTHNNDVVTNDLYFWLPEVSQSCHSCQRRAVEKVSRI